MGVMASSTKQKIESPEGKLMYVTIDGQGTKHPKAKDYNYECSVLVDKKEAKTFKKMVLDYFDANRPRGFKGDPDNEKNITREVDGGYLITFKTRAEFEGKGKTKVGIYNSDAEEVTLPEDVKIGNGSVGLMSGAMDVYGDKLEAGVSLYLSNIMIYELVEYVPDAGFSDERKGKGSFKGYEGESGLKKKGKDKDKEKKKKKEK